MAEQKYDNWQAHDASDADYLSDSAAAADGRGAANIPPPPPDDNWFTEGAKPFPLPSKR